MKTLNIETLISSCDYISECGNNIKVYFEYSLCCENIITAIDENGNETYHHKCDKLLVEDGLIVFNGKYYEAFVEKRVNF